jgi:hypothetical protein
MVKGVESLHISPFPMNEQYDHINLFPTETGFFDSAIRPCGSWETGFAGAGLPSAKI